MKNLNNKSNFFNAKEKIYYYGGVALIALMGGSTFSQAMIIEEERSDEMPRVRCLWNLGTKSYRSSALEIMEKKVLNEPSQEKFENFKLKIKYIKKLGEFLKENPEPTSNLEILKPEKENEALHLAKFYQETLGQIATSALTAVERDLQTLKLKIFYSRLPQELTKVNITELKNDIDEVFTNLLLSGKVDKNKIDYFIYFYAPENDIVNQKQLKTLKSLAVECSDPLLKSKINFKLALTKNNIDKKMGCLEPVQNYYPLAKYHIAELYNTVGTDGSIEKACTLYSNIVNNDKKSVAYPLAAYRLAKFHEKGLRKGHMYLPPNPDRAIQLFTEAANQGHPCAQYDLAKDFFGKNDVRKGFELLEKSAEGGHSPAQLLLAKKYVEGHGESIKKDYKKSADQEEKSDFSKASFWYKKAATQGEEEAYYPAGYICEIEKNYKEASSLYEKSPDPRAQVRLGKMYLNGKGKDKSELLAMTYLQKAGNQENADGNYYLGLMNFRGQGSDKSDLQGALKHITAAANQNHPKALFRLGIMKQFGIETKQSYEDAKESYEKTIVGAASYYANKNPLKTLFRHGIMKSHEAVLATSSYYLGGLYKRGLVEQDRAHALRLWEQAANLGHKEAAYKVGKAHLNALCGSSEKNPKLAEKARIYLEKAGSAYIDSLYYLLGIMQEKGIGCAKNPIEANKSYIQAADVGHAVAQFKVGEDFDRTVERGLELTEKSKTLKYYTLAADQHHVKACLALASLYQEGNKLEEASHYFEIYEKEASYPALSSQKKKRVADYLEWFEEKANEGNPHAQYDYAKLLEEGVQGETEVLLPQDIHQAIDFYQKAAKKGNRSAQRRLDDFKQAHLFEALGIEG